MHLGIILQEDHGMYKKRESRLLFGALGMDEKQK